MPCSVQLDDHLSVTIRSDRGRRGGWEARGELYVTATCRDVGVSVSGEGRTLPAAEARALAAARRSCPRLAPRRSRKG